MKPVFEDGIIAFLRGGGSHTPTRRNAPLGRSDGKSAPIFHKVPTTATGSLVEPPIRKSSGICGGWGDSEVAGPGCGDYSDLWGRKLAGSGPTHPCCYALLCICAPLRFHGYP